MVKHRFEMSLEDRKIELILRLYVDLADQDYLSARHAYHNGLFHIFYWCSAQSIEKYMKSSLLMQGLSAQDKRHNLIKMFEAVRSIDDEAIVPDHLDLPATTANGRQAWQDKPIELFIEYISQYGSPDNRYGFEGTYVNGPILHALDLLNCSLRSLIRKKNLTGSDLFLRREAEVMLFERSGLDEPWMLDSRMMLERLRSRRYHVGETEELRKTFHNMNFSFFRERSEDERSFGGKHFIGSPLHNHLVRLGKVDDSEVNQETVLKLREWASENLQMSKLVRRQLGYPVD